MDYGIDAIVRTMALPLTDPAVGAAVDEFVETLALELNAATCTADVLRAGKYYAEAGGPAAVGWEVYTLAICEEVKALDAAGKALVAQAEELLEENRE